MSSRNVIYYNSNANPIPLAGIANLAYTDVIIGFLVPDGNLNWVQPVWLQLSRERKSLTWCEKAPVPGIPSGRVACATHQYSLTRAEM